MSMKIHGPGGWLDCLVWCAVAVAIVVLIFVGIASNVGALP